jgi:hypothetical protein
MEYSPAAKRDFLQVCTAGLNPCCCYITSSVHCPTSVTAYWCLLWAREWQSGPRPTSSNHLHNQSFFILFEFRRLCISPIPPFSVEREYPDVSQQKHIHKPFAMWTTLNCLPNKVSAWSLYSPEELRLSTGKYSV